ncbi:MAG: cation:proton antiporter, partial [Bacteroidota bacterium]
LGIAIQEFLKSAKVDLSQYVMGALELLGIIGLIMIVLEAALDLKLKKEKSPLLLKSFAVALIALVGTAFAIGGLFYYSGTIDNFFDSLLYAIPLSILSSAIIIPSVGSLIDEKKEFLIYESTFSDILGIMFFYFLLGNEGAETTGEVVLEVTGSIALTIVLSVVISYTLVILLQRVEAKVKLFFFISVLVALYSIGKTFHLSSLLIIMVFGLVLNNPKVFFIGFLEKFINNHLLDEITEDFHVVTNETAFVVRTFFFVIFGMTLDFSGIANVEAIAMALGILAATYLIRFVLLKLFVRKSITPQLWIAPRGLITVLLFFSIPVAHEATGFNPTILLIVILASSFIMSGGLIAKREDDDNPETLEFNDWEELDKEIEELSSKQNTTSTSS